MMVRFTSVPIPGQTGFMSALWHVETEMLTSSICNRPNRGAMLPSCAKLDSQSSTLSHRQLKVYSLVNVFDWALSVDVDGR